MKSRIPKRRRRGSVLLLVLWMLIILGMIGLSYSGSVRTQLQVSQAVRDRTEAYWAARAGIEKAGAVLSMVDVSMLTSADPLFDDEETFADQRLGAARYWLLVPPVAAGEQPRFGLIDESSLININRAGRETLLNLPAMTEEMVDCLIDWRDEDAEPEPLGAEDEFYQSLEDPYFPRNGPLDSIDELKRVRAWAPVFNAAFPDPYTMFLRPEDQPPMADPEDSRLLLSLITAWSTEENLAPDGQEKMSLSDTDADTIRRRIPSLSEIEARSIAEYDDGDGEDFQSVTDLLDVTRAEEQQNQGQQNRSTRGASSQGSTTSSGSGSNTQPIFNLARVGEIIDYFTMEDQDESSSLAGRVNMNTAPYEVLISLDGMTDSIATSIIQDRAALPWELAGQIAEAPGMDETAFRAVYPQLTTTSSRFRLTCRGLAAGGRVSVTIETVLELDEGDVRPIYWRER